MSLFLHQNRFGEIKHYITCSPMDPLQWMGAARNKVCLDTSVLMKKQTHLHLRLSTFSAKSNFCVNCSFKWKEVIQYWSTHHGSKTSYSLSKQTDTKVQGSRKTHLTFTKIIIVYIHEYQRQENSKLRGKTAVISYLSLFWELEGLCKCCCERLWRSEDENPSTWQCKVALFQHSGHPPRPRSQACCNRAWRWRRNMWDKRPDQTAVFILSMQHLLGASGAPRVL